MVGITIDIWYVIGCLSDHARMVSLTAQKERLIHGRTYQQDEKWGKGGICPKVETLADVIVKNQVSQSG
jgi:hypothetical protein